MKTTILIVSIIAIVVLLSMDISYGGDMGIVYEDVVTSDNEDALNDQGHVSAEIKAAKQLNITLFNAYPGYEAYVRFYINNTGPVNATVFDINVTNPNPEALDVVVSDIIEGEIIPVGSIDDGLVTITIKQPAQECGSYNFHIDIEFVEAPQ